MTLVVGLLGAGIFFLGRHLNGAWAAKDAINAAIDHIEEADVTIVALNDAVASAVDETSAENAASLSEQTEDATQALRQADESLAKARELDEFLDDNSRSICDALRSSIDARRQMLVAGEEILSVDSTAGAAYTYLKQAVDKALEANEVSQQATAAANEYAQFLTGDTNVATQDANVALELDNQVISIMGEANNLLASAKEAFGDADYSLYETYFARRLEAAQAMQEADNALVSGDFKAASEKTQAYNDSDTAASEAAAALPASIGEIFAEPYAKLTEAQRQTYSSAATKATEADALIRHYQGVAVSTTTAATVESATSDVAATTTTPATGTTPDVSDTTVQSLPTTVQAAE